MTNYSSGITAVLARMDTNPAEFFGDAAKWGFIFKDRFREVLTEPEKGALHEKLKEVRRQEFDHMVMRTLLDNEIQGTWGTSIVGATGARFTNQGQGQIAQNTANSTYVNQGQGQIGSGFGRAVPRPEGGSIMGNF